MAVVQGIREKVHLPLYDSVSVDGEKQISDIEKSGTLKFFVNVQGKTKLETNLQSASLLPHYNTFEARAMRVVISDLPPEFPDDEKNGALATTDDLDVFKPGNDTTDDQIFASDGSITTDPDAAISASVEVTVSQLAQLYKEVHESDDGTTTLDVDDTDVVTLVAPDGTDLDPGINSIVANAGGVVELAKEDLDDMNDSLKARAIPKEQVDPNNGSVSVNA